MNEERRRIAALLETTAEAILLLTPQERSEVLADFITNLRKRIRGQGRKEFQALMEEWLKEDRS
jgi:hypothetical protein